MAKHPKRFIGFAASLPLNNERETAKEFDRAISQLGAFGFQLFSNVAGKPLDSDEFSPIFEEAARRDIPLWLHPARGANFPGLPNREGIEIRDLVTFGWPYDTSVAMSRIVFAGIFDRFPNLKIITHHMGGMVPYFEGRVGYGWDQLGSRTSDVDYGEMLHSMKKRPIDYSRNFYADTALFGARGATRCGLDFFGVDRVVFASDMPFEPTPGLYARETIEVIDSLGLALTKKTRSI